MASSFDSRLKVAVEILAGQNVFSFEAFVKNPNNDHLMSLLIGDCRYCLGLCIALLAYVGDLDTFNRFVKCYYDKDPNGDGLLRGPEDFMSMDATTFLLHFGCPDSIAKSVFDTLLEGGFVKPHLAVNGRAGYFGYLYQHWVWTEHAREMPPLQRVAMEAAIDRGCTIAPIPFYLGGINWWLNTLDCSWSGELPDRIRVVQAYAREYKMAVFLYPTEGVLCIENE